MNKQRKRALEDKLFRVAGVPLVNGILRALALTVRFTWSNREQFDAALASRRPVIFAFWHEDLIGVVMTYLKVHPGPVAVMVSRSRDGEKLAQVIRRVGSEPVRASSSRGAVAGVVELCRYLRRDHPRWGRPMPGIAALALDGPRGPRRVAKPGAALIACKTGALVVPIAFAHRRQTVFGSWDRTRLPWPFSRSRVAAGKVLDAADWAGDDAAFSEQLATRLQALHAELERTALQKAD